MAMYNDDGDDDWSVHDMTLDESEFARVYVEINDPPGVTKVLVKSIDQAFIFNGEEAAHEFFRDVNRLERDRQERVNLATQRLKEDPRYGGW